MSLNETGQNTPRNWSVFLVFAMVPLVASANDKNSSKSSSYTPPKASAPTRAATPPARHAQESTARYSKGSAAGYTKGPPRTTVKANVHLPPTSPVSTATTTPSTRFVAGSPTHTVSLGNGGTATVSPDGKVRSIQASGVTINHGLQGQRQIVTERNGQRLVSTGPNQGYSQRAYVTRNGQTYVQRTYVVNNATYTRVYSSYTYSGVTYYNYVPVAYYHPAFYGWVYNPWPGPVYYRWGWYGAPWYASYGYYYAPYPAYPVASLWLTDFLLAENLRLAYEAQANAAAQAQSYAPANARSYAPSNSQSYAPASQAAQGGSVVLTPEVKQAIAEEVKAELAAEQAAAASPQPTGSLSGPPPALDPVRRVFVVASNVSAAADSGQECTLTSGDIITRVTDTPNKDQRVTVLVTSSKRRDCSAGLMLSVPVQELQEMHNHFREQIDSGLKILADSQGKGDIPAAPDTRTVGGEIPQPPPDVGIQAKLVAQQAEADRMEAEVNKRTVASAGAGS